MSSNIDRAADTIYHALNGQYGDFYYPTDAAQALADVDLLAPELPEPTGTVDGLPVWGEGEYSTSVADHPCGHGLFLHTPYGQWVTPDEARREALRLLAAADYAERNQP